MPLIFSDFILLGIFFILLLFENLFFNVLQYNFNFLAYCFAFLISSLSSFFFYFLLVLKLSSLWHTLIILETSVANVIELNLSEIKKSKSLSASFSFSLILLSLFFFSSLNSLSLWKKRKFLLYELHKLISFLWSFNFLSPNSFLINEEWSKGLSWLFIFWLIIFFFVFFLKVWCNLLSELF